MNKQKDSLWREPRPATEQAVQQQQAGYPRVIGYHPGVGYVAGGYVAGEEEVEGAEEHEVPVPVVGRRRHRGPVGHSAPWRPMVAPGSPPIGEGHVPLPLNAETFNGVWGSGGATSAASITFSARPQKPFKMTRLLVGKSGTSGGIAIAHLVGQAFVGTDLQQGEVGNIDLENLGAPTAFDTWMSFKQAEPGVWIRCIAQLLGAPTFVTTTDFVQYNITAIGHYLH
jgi:hypothetical protein